MILIGRELTNEMVTYKLEVCVDSLDSVAAIGDLPVSRIELCSCLIEGGLTPSLGMLKLARKMTKIPIFCMIRPRGGDFLYSENEFACMLEDVDVLKPFCDGFVFGILNRDGTIDEARSKLIIDACRPKEITFHRSFDVTRNLEESLSTLIKLRVDRVLTSGGEATAVEGKNMISKLIDLSQGKIGIMVGSGISIDNVDLFENVSEFHLSGKKNVISQMEFENNKCDMGHPKIMTDRQIVIHLLEKLQLE